MYYAFMLAVRVSVCAPDWTYFLYGAYSNHDHISACLKICLYMYFLIALFYKFIVEPLQGRRIQCFRRDGRLTYCCSDTLTIMIFAAVAVFVARHACLRIQLLKHSCSIRTIELNETEKKQTETIKVRLIKDQ